jgi:hypothetical protein
LTTLIHDLFKKYTSEDGGVAKKFMLVFIVGPLLVVIDIVFITLLVPFLLVVPYLFDSVFNIITTDTIPPGSCHVPSFYAPKTASDRYSRMLVFAFFGVIFGGLHVVGWSFEFPTLFEQTLWRMTSITITAIPLVVASIDFLIAQNISSFWLPKIFLISIMTILLCIYVPARLSLICQAIALLRHQPPSAFISVKWAMFVPHILSS